MVIVWFFEFEIIKKLEKQGEILKQKEPLKISAKKVVKFRAGKLLKEVAQKAKIFISPFPDF